MTLTLRKIIKIVDTRWRILRLKCTKFDFGWGSAQDPAGGAYSALPDPLAGFGGRFAAGGEGEGEGKGREGKRKGGPQVTVEPGPLRALLRHCFIQQFLHNTYGVPVLLTSSDLPKSVSKIQKQQSWYWNWISATNIKRNYKCTQS